MKKTEREILEEAKEFFINHRWVKGMSFDDDGGFCALGAVNEVLTTACAPICYTDIHHLLNEKAMEIVGMDHIEIAAISGRVPTAYYNDHVAKTKEDVIVLFEKTIADLP
jgi:hypothetical protein